MSLEDVLLKTLERLRLELRFNYKTLHLGLFAEKRFMVLRGDQPTVNFRAIPILWKNGRTKKIQLWLDANRSAEDGLRRALDKPVIIKKLKGGFCKEMGMFLLDEKGNTIVEQRCVPFFCDEGYTHYAYRPSYLSYDAFSFKLKD